MPLSWSSHYTVGLWDPDTVLIFLLLSDKFKSNLLLSTLFKLLACLLTHLFDLIHSINLGPTKLLHLRSGKNLQSNMLKTELIFPL